MEHYGDGGSFGDVARTDGKALVCAEAQPSGKPYEGAKQ
jgi:hypothetical protein